MIDAAYDSHMSLATLPPSNICDRAREARDARFDGLFFTGVTSTGIYCRPVCPAPAAKRRNIRYFATAAAAAAAGFRPCLRCRPELAPGAMAHRLGEALIDRAQAAERTEDVWALDGAAHGMTEVLGLVTLARMDRQQSEIGYWVAPGFWNTGIASEAVRALIAANPHGAAQIFAEVFQDNPGSARVLTNCGFDYLGDAEAFSVARGATVPTWTYALRTGG